MESCKLVNMAIFMACFRVYTYYDYYDVWLNSLQFYYQPCFANPSFLAFLVKTIHSHLCCFQPKHGRRPEDQVFSGCNDDDIIYNIYMMKRLLPLCYISSCHNYLTNPSLIFPAAAQDRRQGLAFQEESEEETCQ